MNSIRNRVYAGEIAGGADTVEYVIVAIVAVVIGAALIAFGNQMRVQMDKTATPSPSGSTAPVRPPTTLPARSTPARTRRSQPPFSLIA